MLVASQVEVVELKLGGVVVFGVEAEDVLVVGEQMLAEAGVEFGNGELPGNVKAAGEGVPEQVGLFQPVDLHVEVEQDHLWEG